jgi:hypothetical protein
MVLGWLPEAKTCQVIQEDPLPGGEGVSPKGVHQAQEPLHLFSVNRVEVREVQITPPLAIQLISDQLGDIVGVG